MKSFLLVWMFWNAVLGGGLLLLGCSVAVLSKSPVRRLRLLEWTLCVALVAPLLASIAPPWTWTLRWLPARPTTTAIVAPASDLRPAAFAPAEGVVQGMPALAPGTSRPLPVAASSRSWEAPGWHDLLLMVHGGAAILIIGWWLLGTTGIARLWAHSRPAEAALEYLPAGATRSVEVRGHPKVPMPCAFGLWRWRILLPSAMASTPGQPLRFALAHEWAHLERGDLWTWRLTRFALFTLWFQPAYWWLRWQVRLCQDYLADDEASRLERRSDFAAFLVQSARAQQAMLAGAALPLSSRRSDLARRIAMLLNRRAPLEGRCPRSFQSAAALVVVLLLTGAAIIRIEAQDTALPKGRDAEATMAAAENGITYGGRVITYGTEAPIAGAEVVVRRFLAGDPLLAEVAILETTEHTTDADGYYSFTLSHEQVAERHLRIALDISHAEHVARKGFGGALDRLVRDGPMGDQPFLATIRLQPARSVTGVLLTPEGRPAAHVPIFGFTSPEEKRLLPNGRADQETRGSFLEATTDGDGRFRVPIATPGEGGFWFLPPDAAPLGVVAPAGHGTIGNVQLEPGLRTRGRLLDADGRPVPGVRVVASRLDSESPELDEFKRLTFPLGGYRREATTDAEGRFELAPVDAGTFEWRIGERDPSEPPAAYAGAFLHKRLSVTTDGQEFEFRAVPTLAIRAQNVDSNGQPTRGHEFIVAGFLREPTEGWFHTRSDRTESGLDTARVPKGLQQVWIQFSSESHRSLRVRRSPAVEPERIGEIRLDRLDSDLEGIEVIRYRAPVLVVKAVDTEGNVIRDFRPTARFNQPNSAVSKDEPRFHPEEDGRWRSISLVPDEPITVCAIKAGWKADNYPVTLAEGAERELVIVMTRW